MTNSNTVDLLLIRQKDDYGTEWLVVAESYAGMEREILRLKWTEDLKHWMDLHREQIEIQQDVNVFIEYRRLLKSGTPL